jgi:hypothetical protein
VQAISLFAAGVSANSVQRLLERTPAELAEADGQR